MQGSSSLLRVSSPIVFCFLLIFKFFASGVKGKKTTENKISVIAVVQIVVVENKQKDLVIAFVLRIVDSNSPHPNLYLSPICRTLNKLLFWVGNTVLYTMSQIRKVKNFII